jgi:hypothetical protein
MMIIITACDGQKLWPRKDWSTKGVASAEGAANFCLFAPLPEVVPVPAPAPAAPPLAPPSSRYGRVLLIAYAVVSDQSTEMDKYT